MVLEKAAAACEGNGRWLLFFGGIYTGLRRVSKNKKFLKKNF